MKNLIFTLFFGLISIACYSQSIIDFSEETHDFGNIKFTGDTLVAKFLFKNKGVSNLEIYNAKASCGCAIVSYPTTISPGQSGYITVKYYNANPGFINKSISIITNDPNNQTVVLRIKGQTYKTE